VSWAEQLVLVAHAARNTKVPFMVLKDRVLNRGQSPAALLNTRSFCGRPLGRDDEHVCRVVVEL
jgi:hypothetical protein